MGSLKAWSLAGAVATGLASSALAADLPPPPVIEPVPGAAISELGTGWYLRGDIGYVDYDRPKEALYGITNPPPPPLENLKLDDVWSIGGGFGYKFNNWFRTDVTVDYRLDSDFFTTSSVSAYRRGFTVDRATFNSTTAFLNGYLDLGFWLGVTPYVGAGIGVAENRFEGHRAQQFAGSPDVAVAVGAPYSYPAKATYNLAWALMAGVAVDVGAGFTLDLGYRYTHLGEVKTGLDPWGFGIKTKPIEAQEVRLGVRYMID